MTPQEKLGKRLPDPIADVRPTGKVLRILADMRQQTRRNERSV